MPHTTMSAEQVVAHLHLSKQDVDELVNSGEVPFEKKGGRLVFRKKDIDLWSSQRLLGLSSKKLSDYHKKITAKTHTVARDSAILPELMKVDYIDAAVASRTRASVLEGMAKLAGKTSLVMMPDELLTSLKDREKLCSTALSGGIALLHPGTHQPYMFEDSFIVLGRTVQEIPFSAPDGQMTDLFFLICCQDDRIHLHVLARICMICYHTSILYQLRNAKTAQEMYALLMAAEADVIKQM